MTGKRLLRLRLPRLIGFGHSDRRDSQDPVFRNELQPRMQRALAPVGPPTRREVGLIAELQGCGRGELRCRHDNVATERNDRQRVGSRADGDSGQLCRRAEGCRYHWNRRSEPGDRRVAPGPGRTAMSSPVSSRRRSSVTSNSGRVLWSTNARLGSLRKLPLLPDAPVTTCHRSS